MKRETTSDVGAMIATALFLAGFAGMIYALGVKIDLF